MDEAQEFMAKRMKATTESIDGSHTAFIANPATAAAFIMLMPTIACAITGESAEDLEVRSAVIEFYSAVSSLDVAALRRCTTPAFHLVMDGVDYDLETTIGTMQEEAKHGRTTLKTSNIRVERNGRTATVSVDVAATFQGSMSGNPIVSQLAATFALARESSGWRIVQETQTRRPSADADGYSIALESVEPAPGTTLVAGATVSFKVSVSYRMSIAPHGKISLVFEDQNYRALDSHSAQVSVDANAAQGVATLAQTVTVPPHASALWLFVPLLPDGYTNTRGEINLMYRVAEPGK